VIASVIVWNKGHNGETGCFEKTEEWKDRIICASYCAENWSEDRTLHGRVEGVIDLLPVIFVPFPDHAHQQNIVF
jgi:hypothetical protein